MNPQKECITTTLSPPIVVVVPGSADVDSAKVFVPATTSASVVLSADMPTVTNTGALDTTRRQIAVVRNPPRVLSFFAPGMSLQPAVPVDNVSKMKASVTLIMNA
mmetsp:Transcript_42474/g.68358  ORF Transcript_42474/g.68358 Transcript_42474/m.68358 type:complete len:105 (+) Transcript_42474:2035-2349(+)